MKKMAQLLGRYCRKHILNEAEKLGGKRLRKELEEKICNPITINLKGQAGPRRRSKCVI